MGGGDRDRRCRYRGGSASCSDLAQHEGWCILHDPDVGKDAALLDRAVDERLQALARDEKPADFSGAVFPHPPDLPRTFTHGLVLRGTTFHLRLDLDGVVIGSPGHSANAEFQRATFLDGLSLDGAQMNGRASFEGAVFGEPDQPNSGPSRFEEARFRLGARFSHARFHHRANFSRAEFGVARRSAGIRDSADDDDVNADGPRTTWFIDTLFARGVSFAHAQFFHEANMPAQFGAPGSEVAVDFHYASFHHYAVFDGAVFDGRSYFTQTRFTTEAPSFRETRWTQTVTFEDAVASAPAFTIFSNVSFGSPTGPVRVLFDRGEFARGPEFDHVDIHGDVSFRDARIGELTCRHTRFFAGAAFHGRDVIAPAPREGESSEPEPTTGSIQIDALTDVTFHEPKRVSFKRVDLRACSFTNTDLRDVEFSEVTWPGVRRGLHWRLAIFDDPTVGRREEAPRAATLGEAERIYRQLRANYEALQTYEEAGHFHYGELEMRRLRARPLGRMLSLLNVYRLSSGYGNRYVRAGLVLLGFVILFGIAMLRGSTEFQRPGRHYLPWPNGAVWWDIGRAFLLALQAATFQRPSGIDRVFGQIVATVEIIVLPAQVTLFVLALGRRFKR